MKNWWYKRTHQSIDPSLQLANLRHIVKTFWTFLYNIYIYTYINYITGLVIFSFRVVRKKKNFRHFAIEFSVYVSDGWEMMVACYCARRVWTLMHRQNLMHNAETFLQIIRKLKATTAAHNGAERDKKAFCDWNRISILSIFNFVQFEMYRKLIYYWKI